MNVDRDSVVGTETRLGAGRSGVRISTQT